MGVLSMINEGLAYLAAHTWAPQFTIPSLCLQDSLLQVAASRALSLLEHLYFIPLLTHSLKRKKEKGASIESTNAMHNSEMVMQQGLPWPLTSCICNDFLQIMETLFFAEKMKYDSAAFHR